MYRAILNGGIAPRSGIEYTWRDRLHSIPLLAPVFILVLVVLGSIYTGWATPTEAAAVGVVGALFSLVSQKA